MQLLILPLGIWVVSLTTGIVLAQKGFVAKGEFVSVEFMTSCRQTDE